MAASETEGLLTFAEFRAAVGYSDWRVRAGLLALGLRSLPGADNQRKTYYRPDWVPQVRAWIDGKVGEGTR